MRKNVSKSNRNSRENVSSKKKIPSKQNQSRNKGCSKNFKTVLQDQAACAGGACEIV